MAQLPELAFCADKNSNTAQKKKPRGDLTSRCTPENTGLASLALLGARSTPQQLERMLP